VATGHLSELDRAHPPQWAQPMSAQLILKGSADLQRWLGVSAGYGRVDVTLMLPVTELTRTAFRGLAVASAPTREVQVHHHDVGPVLWVGFTHFPLTESEVEQLRPLGLQHVSHVHAATDAAIEVIEPCNSN
jgi:hypothetical protein